MKVIISASFYKKLNNQVKYIAKDKPSIAFKFRKNVLIEIRKIPDRIWSYKKSEFFDDDHIRESIYKGYRIVFEVRQDCILIFGFHKWEETLGF